MASTSRTLASEFDRAQGRTELSGIGWYNIHFPKNVFDSAEVGSKCRFMCYPQKSMRSWRKGSKKGPTVVVSLLFPDVDLTTLRCGLQLIRGPLTGNDTAVVSASKYIPGFVAPLPLEVNDPDVPAGWKRVVAYWPGGVTGLFDFVQDLNGKVDRNHFLRASFRYGDEGVVAFVRSGRVFKIIDDMSTEVKLDGTGMVADIGDLGWFNMVNAGDITTLAIKRKIWMDHLNTLPGIEPLECFHEIHVPAPSLAGGSEGVDIKRPPYVGAVEFDEPPKGPPASEMMKKWLVECLTIDDEDHRDAEEPRTSPSVYYGSTYNSSDGSPSSFDQLESFSARASPDQE